MSHALRPWSTRLEQSLARALFSPERRRNIVLKHDLDQLSRADIEARYKSYGAAVTNGILSADEIRELEGWGPRPDGKGGEFIRPLNMTSQPDA